MFIEILMKFILSPVFFEAEKRHYFILNLLKLIFFVNLISVYYVIYHGKQNKKLKKLLRLSLLIRVCLFDWV